MHRAIDHDELGCKLGFLVLSIASCTVGQQSGKIKVGKKERNTESVKNRSVLHTFDVPIRDANFNLDSKLGGLPPNRVGCYLPVTCPADSVAELITLQSSSHSCKSNSKNLMILICVRKYRIH